MSDQNASHSRPIQQADFSELLSIESGRWRASKKPNLASKIIKRWNGLDCTNRRLDITTCEIQSIISSASNYTSIQMVTERCADVVIAGLLLLIFLPLMMIVAVCVCVESRGGFLYRQTRVGLHGEPFTIYKIRTMRTDAEQNGPKWAMTNDTRVTGVGRILRHTRIDELPQLWNVLKGNMSLVGPRPERPEFVEMLKKEIRGYDLRHLVKPGLTGWAQVNFTYASSVQETVVKTSYDLFYITHHSLLLYSYCLLLTPRALIQGSAR